MDHTGGTPFRDSLTASIIIIVTFPRTILEGPLSLLYRCHDFIVKQDTGCAEACLLLSGKQVSSAYCA